MKLDQPPCAGVFSASWFGVTAMGRDTGFSCHVFLAPSHLPAVLETLSSISSTCVIVQGHEGSAAHVGSELEQQSL